MAQFFAILGKIVAFLLVLVLVALLGFKLFDRVKYNDFYSNAEKVFKTPGINTGYVPQGMDYIEIDGKGVYVTDGYMSDDTASRVYVVYEDGKSTYATLQKANGKDYTGHTGGLEINGEYVYITGDDSIDVFKYDEIMTDGGVAKQVGEIKTNNNPAHCYIYNGYLLVGSYYKPGTQYVAGEGSWEEMTSPDGTLNHSTIVVFKLDDTAEFGVGKDPVAVISQIDMVQGICIGDGKMFVSTSWGLNPSNIYVYDLSKIVKGSENVEILGKSVPLYYMQESAHLAEDSFVAPPMSEELVYLDGKIVIFNESACNKYIFGKITTGFNIWAYNYK